MEMTKTQKTEGEKNTNVHHVLAQSYFLFFIAVLAGLFLDTFFPVEINSAHPPLNYGVVSILLGTWIAIWAQRTSRNGMEQRKNQRESMTHEHFFRGPYKYFRSPTHVGLTLLVFGYGLITNSLFVVLTTLIFAIISKFVYVKKQEKILEEKYGQSYSDYKKKVRM